MDGATCAVGASRGATPGTCDNVLVDCDAAKGRVTGQGVKVTGDFEEFWSAVRTACYTTFCA